jgi:hypothetical protein
MSTGEGARLADLLGLLGLLGFFIRSPFPTAGGSSADDSNGLVALDVGDDHETVLARASDQNKPVFTCGVIGIWNRDRSRIFERRGASPKLTPCFR